MMGVNLDLSILMYREVGLEFRGNHCNGEEESRVISAQAVPEIRTRTWSFGGVRILRTRRMEPWDTPTSKGQVANTKPKKMTEERVRGMGENEESCATKLKARENIREECQRKQNKYVFPA